MQVLHLVLLTIATYAAVVGLQLADRRRFSPEVRARTELLIEAVDARARGLALRRARNRSWGARAPWGNSVLGLAPWSPALGERVVDGIRAALVSSLVTALPAQGVLPLTPPIFRSNEESCSIIPR